MNSYNGFSGDQRAQAQAWLRAEWKAGRRKPPAQCCACRQDRGILHAHAEDYSRPFGDHIDRFHLCYRCHILLHCRFRNGEAWDSYREAVRLGWQFAPIFVPDFGEIQRQLRGDHVDRWNVGVPTSFPLDEITEGVHRPAWLD